MSEKEKAIDLYGLLCACLHRIVVILAVTLVLGFGLGLFQYVKLNKKDSDGNSVISSYTEQLAENQAKREQYDSELENVEEKIRSVYQPWNSSFFDAWDSVYQTTRIFQLSDLAASQGEASAFVTLWNDLDLFTEMGLNRDAYYTALMTDASGDTIQNKMEMFVSLFDSTDNALILTVLGESPEKSEELADKAETLLMNKWNSSGFSASKNAPVRIGSSSQKVYESSQYEKMDLYSTLIKRRDEITKEKDAIIDPADPQNVIGKWAIGGAVFGFIASIAWICIAGFCRQTLEHGTSAEIICGIPMIGGKKTENPYLAEQIKVLSNQYGKILILSDVSVEKKSIDGLCSEKVRFYDDFFRSKDALGALETSDAVILLGKTGVSSATGFERIKSFAENINKPTIGYIMK